MAAQGLRETLAAILAADASGYSRLMDGDQHATVAALDAARGVFRQQIEAHRGRLVDTAGDSVLPRAISTCGAATALRQPFQRGECREWVGPRQPIRRTRRPIAVLEIEDASLLAPAANGQGFALSIGDRVADR